MIALLEGIIAKIDRERVESSRLPKRIYVGRDVLRAIESKAAKVTDNYCGSASFPGGRIEIAGCVWNGIHIIESDMLAPDQWWPDYEGDGLPR